MHRAFAAWILGQPWRAAFMAACFGLLSPQGLTPFAVAAGAVPAFIALRADAWHAAGVAAAGMAAVITSLILAGQNVPLSVSFAIGIFVVPLALALVLKRSQSLPLVFQLCALAAFAVLVGLYAVLDRPAAVWEQLLSEAAQALQQAGVEIDANLMTTLARSMWGTYLALWLLSSLGAVFLARWWQALLVAPGRFGVEFRELRLGKALGLLSIAAVLVALASDRDFVDSVAWIAVTALAFQGLAAAHRQKASGRLRRSWLVAIYVFLIMPFFSFIAVSVLAGWGLADNWRRLRMSEIS